MKQQDELSPINTPDETMIPAPAKPKPLYAIAQEIVAVVDALLEMEGDDQENALARLDGLEMALAEKALNCVHVIKTLDGDIAFAKDEEAAMKRWRAARENTKERLRSYLAFAMDATGTKSIKQPGMSIILMPGKAKSPKIDAEKLPDAYVTIEMVEKRVPIASKIAVALERGETIPGVTVETPKPFITIR